MSSLRNAVKRVTHKERSQPQKRQHLGMLEKKKDYKERAVDYHRKEDRIKKLREKASMRNPDEFYFGMNSSKVKDGHHRSLEDARNLPAEMIQIMKDQDLTYVRMHRQKDVKRAERMQASLHLLETADDSKESKTKRKHTVFVNSKKEAEDFDVTEHFDTLPELAGRTYNRLRKEDVKALAKARFSKYDADEDELHQPTRQDLEKHSKVQRQIAKKIAKARSTAYGEMEARVQRANVLKQAEDHLVTAKNLSGKGRKRKIKAAENGKPAQYKWRRQRLR